MIEVAHKEYSKDPNEFEKLLIDAEKPLKEFANATECPECGQSRWKNVKERNEERKQIPSKVICERIEDGKLRHPADSPAWKLVDFKWPDFGSEPRNLRLVLSADGVNPHGTLLDIPGKSKDRLNARHDLVDLKLRPELASINREKKIFIPHLKLNSLKSHDFHVLIQQLFPIYGVSTELEVGNSGVSDNLRWIAHDPHPFVITYSGYVINGCRYHTKFCEKDQSVLNSGVSLVAKTTQVSSSKDKNPVIGDMSFYGVIQEIWELNYNTFNVSVFKCDWVQNSGGVRIDELELGVGELDATVEEIDTRNETPKELKRRRGPTIMFDVTRIRSLGDKKVVRYNEDGVPIDKNGVKLKSFIGSATYYHVPITYTSWKSVPAELKDKIFTTIEFKNWLTTKYIMPHKDEPQLLQVPPEKYSFIEQNHWEEFVRSRLSETF
ncbi:putative serine/threonine-protein kinase nek2 [Cucumis melo var. makuwa]|uniref:Putative serine/threonine-protein kinase nek2 n=1 Tax=Cucumis melo var. makuwa TaxID=1194695 RepID=A0A5D3BIR7_CUCMM|nr:putative serine/threonine-protein kinase nek2 [Cucumis melo var. makuwa]